MSKRINLISGPRNISTALMYSFGNRSDTIAIDEPMYAYYLAKTGISHPGGSEVINSLPIQMNEVLDRFFYQQLNGQNLFIKGMAHHYHGLSDLSFLDDFINIFLIREPSKLIASFAQVINQPTIQDIGLKIEWELYNYLVERERQVLVLDSAEILKDPYKVLSSVCEFIGIPFSEEMMSWPKGPKPFDGVWAKYWYANVWQSEGFVKQKTSDRIFPQRLSSLLKEAELYYDRLYKESIKA